MFVIADIEYAKRVAKSVQTTLKELGIPCSWSKALDFTAALWGYRDFSHLSSDGIGPETSLYDDACDVDERGVRFFVQLEAAKAFGIKQHLIGDFLRKVKPTSARTKQRDHIEPRAADVPQFVRLSRVAEEIGDLPYAGSILIDALQGADRSQKAAIVAELDRLCTLEPSACFNLGTAYRIGDAGKKDHTLALKYMHACCSFNRGDKTHANALASIGDMIGINATDKGVGPHKDSIPYYRAAALTGHSAAAAFNCGLYHYERGEDELASKFYIIGIKQHHAQSMSNLASMIMERRYRGDGKLMRTLFEEAARQGDGVATNAMGMIESLVRQVDFPHITDEMHGMDQIARHVPFLEEGFLIAVPVKQWIRVLQSKGWQLSNVKTKLASNFAAVALAFDNEGNEIPIHMSYNHHVAGDTALTLKGEFDQRFPDGDAVLICNKLVALNEKDNPADIYLCIGLLRRRGVWSDLFLEEGGLASALKQRIAFETNPQLRKGVAFRCEDAIAINQMLHAATLKNVERFL